MQMEMAQSDEVGAQTLSHAANQHDCCDELDQAMPCQSSHHCSPGLSLLSHQPTVFFHKISVSRSPLAASTSPKSLMRHSIWRPPCPATLVA